MNVRSEHGRVEWMPGMSNAWRSERSHAMVTYYPP